jgi:prepilin peptidase CpaA
MLPMNFILNHWALTILCAAMILAAVIDGWKLKVPNWLTLPLVLSGWLLGLLNNFGLLTEAGFEGGLGAALAGTALGFVLLFPIYSIGGMGAGDVKMQMGFGSWIGAFYGYKDGMPIIWWAFVFGALIGGVIALGMILARGKWRQNLSNTRDILGDLLRGAGQAAEAAGQRKPRMHLLPYGIPLCLGFISYLVYLNGWGF